MQWKWNVSRTYCLTEQAQNANASTKLCHLALTLEHASPLLVDQASPVNHVLVTVISPVAFQQHRFQHQVKAIYLLVLLILNI